MNQGQQANPYNPYAPPGASIASSTAAPTMRYADVPTYRKSWLNSVFLVLGLFGFPPLIWVTCVIVLTGPVYLNAYDERGRLKQWSVANKVVAVVLLLFQIAFIILAVMALKPVK